MTIHIVSAAARYRDLIIASPRHFDSTFHHVVANLHPDAKPRSPAMWEQGFIDQHGVFLTREEAFKHAFENGQLVRRVGGDGGRNDGSGVGKLFSENLY